MCCRLNSIVKREHTGVEHGLLIEVVAEDLDVGLFDFFEWTLVLPEVKQLCKLYLVGVQDVEELEVVVEGVWGDVVLEVFEGVGELVKCSK